MFGIINRLLFGGEEKTADSVGSGEVLEDGWLVVSHQEAMPEDDQKGALSEHQPDSAVHGHSVPQPETEPSAADPEPAVGTSSARAVSGASPRPRLLSEATRSSCIHQAKAWARRHRTSRNGVRRQNRVRRGVRPQSFHLQQPGHRSLGH